MSLPPLVNFLAAQRKLTFNHAQQQHHLAGAVGLAAQYGSGAAAQQAPGAVDASDAERQQAPFLLTHQLLGEKLLSGQPQSQVGSIARAILILF